MNLVISLNMSRKFKTLLGTFQNKNICNIKCKYSSVTDIEIPKRIPRGPTDILKAISSTYQKDPTAAHYKYHDDPYLIPYSNYTKRSYALSQESGRKAAQWIRQQHADLFQHKVADPLIEAYIPKPVYTEDSEVSEQILLNLIKNALVSDAVTVYNILQKKNTELKPSTKESLLQLLCYYNSQDPISEDWIEERWFRSSSATDKIKNSWRMGSLINDLFNELKDSNPSCYSAIISGMVTHGEVSKSMELFDEAMSKGIPLNVEVYNTLLSKVYLMRESHEKIWELIQHLLGNMSDRSVKPNVRTLNSVLESLSKMSTHRNAKIFSLKTLAEFKAFNIEPSLATFLHLLEVHIKDRSRLYSIMTEILKEIEGHSFTMVDPKDVLFFVRAMEICSLQLHDKDLAYQLHNILLKENNYNFIGDSYRESLYYRNFFFLLCKAESLEKTMEFYENVVPGIYIPEPAVTNALLKAIDVNMAWHLLPKMWSDIVLFEQNEVSGVLENILSVAAKNMDEALNEKLSNIAWDIWLKIEGMKKERTFLKWTGSMLGNIVLLLLRANEKAKAHLVMDKLVRLGSTLMNEPPVEAISLYVNSCIQDSSPDLAIKTIQYCESIGFMETSQFALHVNNSLELTDQQRDRLISIVGEDCLKKNPDKSSRETSKQTNS